jgi:hypothetical protein
MDNNEKSREKLYVIFVLFLIALVPVPGSGAEPEEAVRVFFENDTAGYLPVDVLSIDPSIKDSTTDYTFLIMSPEGKETRLNDVNLSIDVLYPGDPQNAILKAGLGREMEEIWDKYPVVFETKPGGPGYPTYGGSLVTVRFASPVKGIRLTEKENSVIKKSASIMNEAFARINQQMSPEPSPVLADPDRIGPTVPHPAAIPFIHIIVAIGIIGAIAICQRSRVNPDKKTGGIPSRQKILKKKTGL